MFRDFLPFRCRKFGQKPRSAAEPKRAEHKSASPRAGWGHPAKGRCRLIGGHTCVRVCGAITFRTKTHGCRAAVPFGLSPKRHQKRFLIPLHPSGRRCYGRGCFAHRAKLPQKAPCGAFCFRRRRIGWEGIYFSSYRRDTAFGRTRQVSAKPKHCILERCVFTLT